MDHYNQFPIDIHPPEGDQQVLTGSGKAVYEIPYRCLIPQGVDNLLVAGRSISATHAAFGSARVMATAMGIGQGAGTAAALAGATGCTTRQVDLKKVRQLLMDQGQYLLGEDIADENNESLKLLRTEGSGASASHYNPFSKKKS